MQTYKPTAALPANLTCLLYGDSGVGKTRSAASWPRVFSISDGTERGYETFGYMDQSEFFEENRPPEVCQPRKDVPGIFNLEDMHKSIAYLEEMVTKRPGYYRTVVVDSLTFIADLYEDLFRSQYADEIKKNKYFLWDKMKITIRSLMTRLHRLPVNVVWLCLASSSEAKIGGPLIVGQMATKLPAACNLLLWMRAVNRGPGKALERQLRSQTFGGYLSKTRYGAGFPDPLPGTTYRDILNGITRARAVAQGEEVEDLVEEETVEEEEEVEGAEVAEEEKPQPARPSNGSVRRPVPAPTRQVPRQPVRR